MNWEEIVGETFQGCISFSKNGTVVWEKAFGYRDYANRISNRTDTIFATASAGKVFVAVGILQMIESGQLHLEDTIGQLLNLDWHDIDRSITIGELLTHTSGIPDYFDESVLDDYAQLWRETPNYSIRSSSDLLPLFLTKPMMFERGAKFQYNNTGFVVLGLILEAISGVPFDVYLEKAVLGVLAHGPRHGQWRDEGCPPEPPVRT